MDKEKLAKHHFWILLGLALILFPVLVGGVWMGVAEATEAKRKEFDAKKSALSGAKPKGQNVIDELTKETGQLEGKKTTVWADAYKKQAGLIEWPRSLEHLNKLYFGDPISDEDRNTFRKNDIYIPEFEALAELIKPTELAGGWQQTIKYVKWGDRFPSNEDCWLALEDLCIVREMMRCVHDVNQLLAQFTKVNGPEVDKELRKTFQTHEKLKDLKLPEDASFQRFVSPYWQLDVAIGRAPQGREFIASGLLKNISHRRLNVARIDFNLGMQDPSSGSESRPGVLSVEGDYLAVGQEVPFRERRVIASAPKPMIYTVEQKLDARYVPVKKLEKISLGYHSHRTADKPLAMCKVSNKAKEDAAKAGGADAAATTDPNAPPAPGAAAPSTDKSQSGIDRLRYLSCTDQVRRMPIGLVMTVDQAHVQDVLRAFANSRLRFQTTQIHVARQRGGSADSSATTSVVGAPPPPRPSGDFGVRPGPPGGELRPGDSGRPVPPAGPALVTQPMPVQTQSGEDSNTNLVEVGIYGLASIYEKYPPKAQPNADGTVATPAAPVPTPANPPATPVDPATPAPPPPHSRARGAQRRWKDWITDDWRRPTNRPQ